MAFVIVQEIPEITTALALVEAGLSVSLIPQSFGSNHFRGIRAHHLSNRAAAWTVAAAWRKDDPNPSIQRFLALLKADLPAESEEPRAQP